MKRRVVGILFAVLLAAASSAAAAVTVSVRPGAWADVVTAPDGFRFVRATAIAVTTERVDGSPIWSTPIPEPTLYLRAATDPSGVVETIMQGNASGAALVVNANGVRALGPSFGQNAVAIAWAADRGWRYYVQTSPTTYTITDAGGVQTVTMPATSQGFRDVLPDGTVRRGDDFFTAAFNGRQFWEYAQRGDVTVGQCDPPAICVAAAGVTFTAIRGDGFEPHVALDGDVIAVAARSAGGAALAIITPPYPSADVLTPPIVVPPAPMPAPTPAPAAEQLPGSVKAIRDAFVARFPVPQMAGPGPSDQAFEDICRAWTLRLAQQVVFSTADASWGVKNAGGGRPQSKDSLARQVGGRLINFDLLSGVGTGRPVLVADPAGEDITGQQFMPVSRVNYVDPGTGTSPMPSPAPQPAPVPAPDLTPILARLAALEAATAALQARVAALETAPATGAAEDRVRQLIADAFTRVVVTGSTGRTLGHVHSINVTLRIGQ